ncbi:MAG TPA: MFS transporter [Gemmatimonadales bacterium]|nr:MFS transporter [Gemmatimonadales bacterium]HYT84649.1 MFS transporter [Gemmatimonadales bacterium]
MIRLGLRANWRQFTLLVLINAFVGAMVGLERTVLPLLAQADFGLASKAATLSFLVGFGAVKAVANLVAGRLADRGGRKRILVAGWLAGLPVPLLLIWAPTWGWVVFANMLLGVNQGLCWSTTVIMKIDLVGPERRGLAMGLNEFAGYVAVSLAALGTGYLAAAHGLRPAPFYPGIGVAIAGLALSLFAVRETQGHVAVEAERLGGTEPARSFAEVLLLTSWKERSLFAASQAGLANNLNDGVVWGLLPILLAARGLPLDRIGLVAAAYPAVWGVAQLATGPLSDRWGRKWMIASGMWVQGAGLLLFVIGPDLAAWLAAAAVLGLGTALVYPTLLAAVSDVAHPAWRASAVGVYRLWRDGGYAVGALAAGLFADTFDAAAAMGVASGLTLVSGAIVASVMRETLPRGVRQRTAAPVP